MVGIFGAMIAAIVAIMLALRWLLLTRFLFVRAATRRAFSFHAATTANLADPQAIELTIRFQKTGALRCHTGSCDDGARMTFAAD